MTDDEQRQLEQDARNDALLIGGVLAVLLGLKFGSLGVRWDAAKGKFAVGGRSVSIATVRRQIGRIEKGLGKKLTGLVDSLAAGTLTLDDWQRETRRTIGSSHVLTGALAAGSIAAAVKSPDVQSRVIAEQRYADDFADEVRRKKAGTFARIAARAKSYMLAAAVTYSVVERVLRGALGDTEAMRVRRASESCSGCVEWSGRWIPINNMVPIGSLQCQSHCRCYLVYR